jgi:hypothetical protein
MPMKPIIEKNDIIQIRPEHKWGGCLAVVDEVKSFGCVAYVASPVDGTVGKYYTRLSWDGFKMIGAKVLDLDGIKEDNIKERP